MASFNLDSSTPVYTLGPEGTFSDEAARRFQPDSSLLTYTRTFTDALVHVTEDPLSAAVVPIENSVAGTVAQVQDSLVSDNLIIQAEVNLPVSYALLANAELSEVRNCYMHPQAFEQTSNYIAHHLPDARPVYTRSNIDSGLQFLHAVSNDQEPVASIVPVSFARMHPELIRAENIQDFTNNTTRFLLVQKRRECQHFDFTRKKTALFVEFQEDRAGLLYQLLSVFNLFQVNLCRLESRPSKSTPWMYVFYVDFYNIDQTSACLEVLRVTDFQYKVLGSYDVVTAEKPAGK